MNDHAKYSKTNSDIPIRFKSGPTNVLGSLSWHVGPTLANIEKVQL